MRTGSASASCENGQGEKENRCEARRHHNIALLIEVPPGLLAVGQEPVKQIGEIATQTARRRASQEQKDGDIAVSTSSQNLDVALAYWIDYGCKMHNYSSGGNEMTTRSFEFKGRIRSFRHAFFGIWTMLKSQRNAWVHACATVAVVVAGFFLEVSPAEWCWLTLAIMAVWTAEALNTAFEFLADVASPEFHPVVKQSKDVAAGAVLISAIGSVVIGLLVLGPHAMERLQ